MGTNGRKGNRTSIPSARGGARRGNTAPPPSVRVPDIDPISTSRPRGNEVPGAVTALAKPPADIVAAVAAAARPPEPEPTAKTPAVAPAPEVPPARGPLPTLESVRSPAIVDDGGPALSQPAPSVGPRSLSGAPGAVRRKGRGSNLKVSTGRSVPPPAIVDAAPKIVESAPPTDPPISSRATVPAPIVEDLPVKGPVSAPPPHSGLDEGFFDHDAPHDDPSDLDGYDERMAQKNSPEARARREKNWTYIRWAAGFCVTLLALALIRNTSHRDEPEPLPVVTVASHPAASPAAEPAGASPQAAAEAPQAAASALGAPAASGAAAASAIPTLSTDELPSAPGAPAAPSASARFQESPAALGVAAKAQGTDPSTTAPVAVAVPADPTEAEKKSAAQEKRSCQSFLDQGAFAKAVEAGERSVALDPADGDAWLMLGAAYQSMGKSAEARRSFSSCVAEAKKGSIGECRSMLR